MFKNSYFRFLVILILCLIVLQLITSYFFSFIVEKELEKQFKHLTSSPFIKVIHHTYKRGIFSSDSTTELAINSSTLTNILNILPNTESQSAFITKNYSIKYNVHIEHGILSSLFHGYFVPSLAYCKTTIFYNNALKKILDKFFNNKPPLEINNILYINKSGYYKIVSPSFNYEETVSGVKVEWEGIKAYLHYNSNFNAFKTSFSIPKLVIIAPTKGSIELNNLDYFSDIKLSSNNLKVGVTNVNLEYIKILWNDKILLNFKLGDILNNLTGISTADFLNSLDVINPTNFSLSNISYTSNSSDKNNYFSANAIIHFESLNSESNYFGPMNLDISLNHILSPQFSLLSDKLREISNIPVTSENESKVTEKLIITLKEYLGPILVDKPIITLNNFNLKTSNGLISFSGNLTTNDFQISDLNDQNKFLKKIVLNLNFNIPKSVLAYLFILQTKYLLSAGNALMDEQSSQALSKVINILLDNQINNWTRKGYLTNNQGNLSSHMKLESDNIILNGIVAK